MSPGIDLYAIGSVTDVIAGIPPADFAGVSMTGFLAAFEAGSPQGSDSIGELVGFNGVAYARSTKPGAEHHTLIYGNRFVSNGAVLLRDRAPKTATIAVQRPTPLVELYEQFECRIAGPLCFVGTAVFDEYDVTAIARAPVYRENIFENRSAYYPEPARHLVGIPAAVMGCVAALAEAPFELRAQLDLVLYASPVEAPAPVTAHTHALELRHPVQTLAEVTPTLAVNVDHLFGSSVVRTGWFDLYRIRRVLPLRVTGLRPGRKRARKA